MFLLSRFFRFLYCGTTAIQYTDVYDLPMAITVSQSSIILQIILLFVVPAATVNCFHDCIQTRKVALDRRRKLHEKRTKTKHATKLWPSSSSSSSSSLSCSGGICVGMTNGPHQGGNASYPVAFNGTHGTHVKSVMTVPEYPTQFDGITYYLWTDVFFGDSEPNGRMNQLVPQLILGDALDGSSGSPDWIPSWGKNKKWKFASHYFFEIFNETSQEVDPHAAYGEFHAVEPGETLYTEFDLSLRGGETSSSAKQYPMWTLTMGVVGDTTRTSILEVPHPYMGLGKDWSDGSTTSWLEEPYDNMCINMCWEIYGGIDSAHLPSSGALYRMDIQQPVPLADEYHRTTTPFFDNNYIRSKDINDRHQYYDFTTWEEDEGNGRCPSCIVKERHTYTKQTVVVKISVSPNSTLETDEKAQSARLETKSAYFRRY